MRYQSFETRQAVASVCKRTVPKYALSTASRTAATMTCGSPFTRRFSRLCAAGGHAGKFDILCVSARLHSRANERERAELKSVEEGKGSRRFVPFAWNFATQGCQDQAFQADHKHYNWYIPKVKAFRHAPKKSSSGAESGVRRPDDLHPLGSRAAFVFIVRPRNERFRSLVHADSGERRRSRGLVDQQVVDMSEIE
jgi:hypothetical protein